MGGWLEVGGRIKTQADEELPFRWIGVDDTRDTLNSEHNKRLRNQFESFFFYTKNKRTCCLRCKQKKQSIWLY